MDELIPAISACPVAEVPSTVFAGSERQGFPVLGGVAKGQLHQRSVVARYKDLVQQLKLWTCLGGPCRLTRALLAD